MEEGDPLLHRPTLVESTQLVTVLIVWLIVALLLLVALLN